MNYEVHKKISVEVVFTKDEIKLCDEFSRESAKTQQRIEFGERTTVPRSIEEIARDNLIGKLGEVAFKRFVKDNFNIHVSLDFKVYPRGVWDSEDVLINKYRIDVKGVREGGRWLFVELNKLDFRRKENKNPDFFVAVSVGWDRSEDIPTGRAELKGYVRADVMNAGVERTKFFKKGESIPGTQTRLQTDNYGRRFSDLRTDWVSFAHLLAQGKK